MAVDVLLDHQASSTPGAPYVITVVELTRISNSTERLADNRSDDASAQRHNHDLIPGQLGIFFDVFNAGELLDLFQHRAQGVHVEILFPVRHDFTGYIPGLLTVLIVLQLQHVAQQDCLRTNGLRVGAGREVEGQRDLSNTLISTQAFPGFIVELDKVRGNRSRCSPRTDDEHHQQILTGHQPGKPAPSLC